MKYAFPANPVSYMPFQFTRNRLEHIISAVDPVEYPQRQDLRYELTLNVPEYAGLQMLAPLITLPGREKPPLVSSNGSTYEGAKFTVQTELDGLLSREKPAFKQAQISVITTLTTPFGFTEVIKYQGEEISSKSLAPQWAIKSGLSENDHDGWGASYWTHYHSNRALTWQPDNKVVGECQEDYLYFLLNFSPVPAYIRLRVDVSYADSTNETIYPLEPIQNVPFGRVLCVPVGMSILCNGLTKSVLNYQTYLIDGEENRISERRTFWPDRRPRRQDRCLLFSNSFQVYDTLRLTGEASENHKVQRYYADRERPVGANADFSELFMIDKIGERELIISTGYFDRDSKEVLPYLSELLLAEEWYLITEKGHEPLELITSSQVSSQDNAGLVSRQYQFRYLTDASNHSALPSPPVFPGRETYWKPSNPQFVLDSYGKRTGYVRYGRIIKTYLDTDTSFVPFTSKSNSPGDADYVPEFKDTSIEPGSTPYPSAGISRLSTYTRATCESGWIGGPLTIVIPNEKYGGENPGEANALAEAEYVSLNTQAYANQVGSCEINTVPIHLAIFHKIPMDLNLQVVGSADFGPVVALRIGNTEWVTNTVGNTPPENRLSANKIAPGVYAITASVNYSSQPMRSCKLRIASKNKEINVSGPGLYNFGNITINSNDEPLTLEVL